MIQSPMINSSLTDSSPKMEQLDTTQTPPEGMRARKAKTSYMYFINNEANRQAVMDEYEKTHPGEKIPSKILVSELASKWRGLSEDEKLPYQEMFNQEREKLSSSPEWIPKKQKKLVSARSPMTSSDTNEPETKDLKAKVELLIVEQKKQQQQIHLLTQIVQQLTNNNSN